MPPYLRTAKRNQQIRNRRFAKRDVELIIKKVPHSTYGLFPDNPYFRNHARLRFTYIFYSRITDYMETHPYLLQSKQSVVRRQTVFVHCSSEMTGLYHIRVRVSSIRHARTHSVGKYQSCMVYNGRLIPHAS